MQRAKHGEGVYMQRGPWEHKRGEPSTGLGGERFLRGGFME